MQDEMISGNIAYTTIWLCGILESILWFVEMIHVICLKLPITRDNRPSFSDNARAVCLPSLVLILTFIDLFNGQHSGNEPLHRLFASKACMYGCIVSTPHFVAWPFSVENWTREWNAFVIFWRQGQSSGKPYKSWIPFWTRQSCLSWFSWFLVHWGIQMDSDSAWDTKIVKMCRTITSRYFVRTEMHSCWAN